MTSHPCHDGPQRSLRVASPKSRLFPVSAGWLVIVGGREDGLSIVSSLMSDLLADDWLSKLRSQTGAESKRVFGSSAHPRSDRVPRPFFQEGVVSTFGNRFGSSAIAD